MITGPRRQTVHLRHYLQLTESRRNVNKLFSVIFVLYHYISLLPVQLFLLNYTPVKMNYTLRKILEAAPRLQVLSGSSISSDLYCKIS